MAIELPPGAKRPKKNNDHVEIRCPMHTPVVVRYIQDAGSGDLLARTIICFNCGMVQSLPSQLPYGDEK